MQWLLLWQFWGLLHLHKIKPRRINQVLWDLKSCFMGMHFANYWHVWVNINLLLECMGAHKFITAMYGCT